MKQKVTNKIKLSQDTSSLKIIKKGNYKIRSISLPNNKIVPLHSQNIYPFKDKLKTEQDGLIPQFWGCIVSDYSQKLQKKTLVRCKRSKTQQKMPSQYAEVSKKQRESSQILLQNYIKRKNKIKTESHQILNEISQQQRKQKKISSIVSSFGEDSVLKRYSDEQAKHQRLKREQQTLQKIQKLNQIIKWRNKIIMKIEDQMQLIKSSKMLMK